MPGGLEEATAGLLQALDTPPRPPSTSSGRFQGRAWGASDVINGTTVDGVTPLHLALSVARDEHGDAVALRLASLLVARGAVPTKADTGGVTPLLLARRWPDAMRVLRPVVEEERMEEGERLFEALHRDPIPSGARRWPREDAMEEASDGGVEADEEEDGEEEGEGGAWVQAGKRKAAPRVDRRHRRHVRE